MTRHEFRDLLESLAFLARVQKQRLIDRVKYSLYEEQGIELIEVRSEQHKQCPHCGGCAIIRWGLSQQLQRCRCQCCGWIFNALSGTPLARLKHRTRWLTHCTDGNGIYRSLTEQENIPRKRIVGLAKVRVIDQIFHLQNLNAYIRRLKAWMIRFNGVSTEYLHYYLGWRRLLAKHTGALSPQVCLSQAMGTNT